VQRSVLLTGGTGFLGKVVLEALFRRREELGIERVWLLIRAPSAALARERLASVVFASPCFAGLESGWHKRVLALPGDLLAPGLGLEAPERQRVCREVTQLIHCAASIDFDLPLPEAARVNVAGALEVLELARSCERLEALTSVSTAYVTPHPRGGELARAEEVLAALRGPHADDPERLLAECLAGSPLAAQALRESGHPNSYTFTKCLAEHLLAARRGDVPLALVRPSIISAARRHPFPGWIDSHAAFAATVALLGTGQLRAVAADPQARVDLVPVDEVAARVVAASFAARPASARAALPILHAVSGRAGSVSVEQCRAVITDFFSRRRAGRGPQLRHLGPVGPGFALREALHQALPAHAAALFERLRGRRRRRAALLAGLERLAQVNRSFAYFTHHSFDFRSSLPLDAGFDGGAYLETICRGVHDHLLRLDSRETLLEARSSLFALWLARRGTRVSFDLDSFDAARAAIAAAGRIVLVPSRGDRVARLALRALRSARPDLGLAAAELPAAPLDALRLRRSQVRGGRAVALPVGVGGEPGSSRLHLVCGRPIEIGAGADPSRLQGEIEAELARATPAHPRPRRRRPRLGAREERSA